MYGLPRALRLRQHQRPIPTNISRHLARRQRNFSQIARRFRPQQTIYSRATGEPMRQRTVRFKEPFFTWRRAATFVIYGGTAYAYLYLVSRYLDVEIEILEEEDLPADDKVKEGEEIIEEDDGYADEDSTFIPLTWATKLPRTFYKGSDPEWQEFVKVAKDKPRHKKIQNELVQVVYTGSMQHPLIARQLGKEAKVGKYWLDISFPDGPPQEFVRSGLEIGEGYVAWSQQKVSAETQTRVMRALWPKAAGESLWATGKVLVGIQWRRVKQALGLEGKDPFSPEERYRHAVEMMEQQQRAKERKGTTAAQQTSPEGGNTAADIIRAGAAAAGSTASSSTTSSPAKSATTTASSDAKPGSNWSLTLPTPLSLPDAPIALHVFSSTLSKTWNPPPGPPGSPANLPPRGTFIVQGLIEIRGQRGRMLFDVSSCYDPKASKFVKVDASVRNYKRWNQAPKGGA